MKITFFLFLVLLSVCSNEGANHDHLDAAVKALMKLYNKNTGLWNTTGWWNSANCLTALIDYMLATGSREYTWAVDNTFQNARKQFKNFTNEFIDDTGWWGLAWVRAYDLTKDHKYLEMAKFDANYMYSYHDTKCGGGLYWKIDKKVKNAIPNELFIKLSASLHNRISGDSKYLKQSIEVWNWFLGTKMINSHNLINDGLNLQTCAPGGTTYTYNQGVILGGLAELYQATKDKKYLESAYKIGDAATTSNDLNHDGILREPNEGDSCSGDGPSFKGIFVRNLGELSKVSSAHSYHNYLVKNANSCYDKNRNQNNEYGNHWAGPFKSSAGACQHGAVDLLTAAFKS